MERVNGPESLGGPLRRVLGDTPLSRSDAVPYTCECGLTIEPVEVFILGRLRKYRGSCEPCELRRQAEERALSEELARRRRVSRYARAFPPSEMGLRLLGAFLDGFEARPGCEAALSATRQLIGGLPAPEPSGLLLWGRAGNGKSHLGAAAANAAREMGLAVAWVHVPTWLVRLGSGLEPEDREQELQLAARADVLVLDELGGVNTTTARAAWLLYVVDYRYRMGRPVVVTVNVDPDALVDALSAGGEASEGERLVDRLCEMCAVVQVTAPSYRQQRAARRPKGVNSHA